MKLPLTKVLITLISILISSFKLQAVPQRNHWMIITRQGDTITSSRFNRIIGDTLFFNCENCKGKIFIDDVAGILRVKYPRYGRNIVVGTLSGFFFGMFIGSVAGPNEIDPYWGWPSDADFTALYTGLIVGTLAGAGTGAVISVSNNKNQVYDFSDKNIVQKEVALRNLCVEK
ncbi:MAG: hypothetical protein IPO83_10110 [Chitinophagaceae bacterium]|nr:hypothetical protein [Chitinophagaceae bacterium]